MRIGKIPIQDSSAVATPDVPTFVFLFIDKTDGKLKMKIATGQVIDAAVSEIEYTGQTVDGVQKSIYLNGVAGTNFKNPVNTSYLLTSQTVAARIDDGSGDSAATQGLSIIKNKAGVFSNESGVKNQNLSFGNAQGNNWFIEVDVNQTGLTVKVTGENNKTINWSVRLIDLSEVKIS